MTQTESPCSCNFKLVQHVLDCLGLLLIIVLQGSILDYYLILHNGGNAAWFLVPGRFSYSHCIYGCCGNFLPTLSKKGRERKVEPRSQDCAKENTSKIKSIFKPGSLPSCIHCVKTHNNAEPHSDHQAYIYFLITSTVFEIFDSVTFLGILFPSQTRIILTYPLENSVLVLSCVNFILPTMTLYKLSLSEFGKQPRSLGLQLLYKCLHLGLVNIPYFVIRVYLWSLYDHDVTLFLLKNILAVVITARTVVPDIKLFWRNIQQSQSKRRKFFSGGMELGAVYEITDHHGDDGNLPIDDKKYFIVLNCKKQKKKNLF
ncbi:hypothetical protein CEXT_725251 [Caerostris extrusa]|uniref:Uncharacterized protein n=1 Tax=Caerostris extrusa TaxID=172846 RepID=A0AAV4NR59_CAEEX|nr:hypothetical protein CEXT_725251 [Caerostris extrusa]